MEEEKRLKPLNHLSKEDNKVLCRMFNTHEIIDFVNWHLKVHKIDDRFNLENLELIKSFLNKKSLEEWDDHMK